MAKAVEWGKLIESPVKAVQRLKVDNRRTRILTDAEQAAILGACPGKLRSIVTLALITGARIGELLALRWEHCQDGYVMFLETKNGRTRRIPVSPAIAAVLGAQPRIHAWVFTNAKTEKSFTVNGARHVFDRAVARANIAGAVDVTLHTLRHTALSRMIAGGIDDFTVMAISGHRSVRMLERYTHPTNARKVDALETFTTAMGRTWAESETGFSDNPVTDANSSGKSGGPQEDRTPDLRIANAALSQLS